MKPRAIFTVVLVFVVACGGSKETGTVQAKAKQQPAPQANSIDQLLAPIALYPDQLLAQILMCAGSPAKVTELDQWLKANASLKGTALQNAAVKQGFDPEFVALSLFPPVVARMADQIAWTTLVGQAFAANKSTVFDAIQRLRHQAQMVGTLKDTPQQDVETKQTSSGQDVIVIEPANPQVVYVPQYNPEVVYTQAPATNVTNVTNVTVVEDDNGAEAAAAGLIGFTAGIAIGASMNNSYYYGPYGWHGGAYMYNDAWNDYYDHREDAREDWMDHREDISEERSDRLENRSEQRTDRAENAQSNRTERAENRAENPGQAQQRAQNAQAQRQQSGASTQSASTQRSTQRTGSAEARGYGGTQSTQQRGSADAFSGYSSGSSQRASSSRGQASRSSSRGGGSRGGGGGRRR